MAELAPLTVWLLKTLRILLIVYGVSLMGAWLIVPKLLFQPQPSSYTALPGLVRIPVAGDTLAAIWMPNTSVKYAVLYSHGNGEDLGDDLPILRELHAAGFSVLAYDYRGYGASTGRASERNAGEDVAAAYAYLTRTLGVAAGRVIVHGRSLGGGPAALIASREPVAGLVLESTFTSALGVSKWGRLFPYDWFRTRRRLEQVRAPVLVIHGTADEVIPFAHGQALFAAVRSSRQSLWVERAGHNDLIAIAGARYWTALRRFADSLPEGG